MKNTIIFLLIFSYSLCKSSMQTVQGSATMVLEEDGEITTEKLRAAAIVDGRTLVAAKTKTYDERLRVACEIGRRVRVREEIDDRIILSQVFFPANYIPNRGNMSQFVPMRSSREPVRVRPHRAMRVEVSATSIEERYDGEERAIKKINPGKDGREQIGHTENWPASVHGAVYVRFPSTERDAYEWGTGVAIGRQVILTAAHNLYDKKTGEEVTKVKFFPAINGKFLPFGEQKVINWWFPEEYKYNEDNTEDYAILVLDSPLGEETGQFGIGILPTEHFGNGFIESELVKDLQISITGYPVDKVAHKDRCYEMWGMQGPIKGINEDFITYEIDTFQGQSGSGICCKVGDQHYVIGVHVRYDIELKVNKAIPLTFNRFKRIQEWVGKSLRGSFQNVACEEIRGFNWGYFGDFEALALASYTLPNLTSLRLGRPFGGVSVEGASVIGRSFSSLIELRLNFHLFGDDGVEALTPLRKLEVLHLMHNKIGLRGTQIIVGAFPHLMILNLNGNNLGDAGVGALTPLTKLTRLYIRNTEVSAQLVSQLRAAIPRLKIVH